MPPAYSIRLFSLTAPSVLNSQEVESLSQWQDLKTLLLDGLCLVGIHSALLAIVALALSGQPRGHIKVRNLVSILAGSWHLDGSSPVEIVVAQGECQVLNLNLFE